MTEKLFFFIFTTVLLAGGPHALADGNRNAEAKIQFQQGIELFKDEKFEQAAISFERAYELRPSYKILWNIAQTENMMGHYAAAMKAYVRYIEEGGINVKSERKKISLEEIERLKSLVGSITVNCDIENADILLDNELKGKTPLKEKIFVDLGRHNVKVVKMNKTLFSQTIKIAGGQSRTIEVIPPQIDTQPTSKSVVTETPATPVVPEPSSPPPDQPEERRKPKRVATWIALGIGAASAVAAGVTGGLSISKVKSVKDNCDGNRCPDTLQSQWKQSQTLGTLSTVYTAVAGVGIATGITLFFLEPVLRKERPSTALVPMVSPSHAGLGLVGRF